MQRHIELIGAAWGLGGAHPGCADAPAVLMPLLEARLRACGAAVRRGALLAPAAHQRKQPALSRACQDLAAAVADAQRAGRVPCVIGGDHSCAAGTWAGVAWRRPGKLGLVWIDAHMDAHTPGTSHTGRMHGMPLAWLLGQHDDDALYGFSFGVVDPAHVCLVGVRSFEPEEKERLDRLGVRVIHMDEVLGRGLDAALEEAFAIANDGTEAHGISIDLDAVTPEEAPGVGTPVARGLAARGLVEGLRRLGGGARLAAVEIVEYVPPLDPDGRTAAIAVALAAAALCGPQEKPHVLSHAVQGQHP